MFIMCPCAQYLNSFPRGRIVALPPEVMGNLFPYSTHCTALYFVFPCAQYLNSLPFWRSVTLPPLAIGNLFPYSTHCTPVDCPTTPMRKVQVGTIYLNPVFTNWTYEQNLKIMDQGSRPLVNRQLPFVAAPSSPPPTVNKAWLCSFVVRNYQTCHYIQCLCLCLMMFPCMKANAPGSLE